MTETIRLTVKRTKAVTDTEQLLIVDLPRESGNIDNVESVLLEAYRITGSASAIPGDVVIELTAGGSDRSGYLSYVFTSGAGVTTHMREQVNYLPLIPPGGLATRDHTTQTLAFRSPNATGMNLTNSQLRLLAFDATARRYIPWNDWTDATFQLVITGTIRHMTVVKTKRL